MRSMLGVIALLGVGVPVAWWFVPEAPAPAAAPVAFALPAPLPTSALPPWSERQLVVERGQNITSVLGTQGVGPTRVLEVIEAAKDHSNLVKIRTGETLTVRWSHGRPTELVRALDRWRERQLVVSLDEKPQAHVEQRPVVRTPVSAAGEIDYTLWDTGVSMGLSPDNLIDLAKIFAWDIDFNTQIQQGDRFRLVIEEVRDARTQAFVRYGAILAAEYQRSSGEVLVAYRYVGADGTVGFFDAQGESSKTPFLKSPIEFSRVSSRFGRRYHPILKRWRAHRGTDYAASAGTPIQTIGDGVVRFVGRKGGYGNHVRIQHNEEHASSYSHLSSFSVRVGQTVAQGDVIGRVGSTGLATGPHLHFEFYQHNKQADYGAMDFDRTSPIAAEERAAFERMLKRIRPMLEGTPMPRGTCTTPLAGR